MAIWRICWFSLDKECYTISQLAFKNAPTTAPTTQDVTSSMLAKESTISLSLSTAGTKQRLSKQKQPNNLFPEIDEKM